MLNRADFIPIKYSLQNFRSCPTCLMRNPFFLIRTNQLTTSAWFTVGLLHIVKKSVVLPTEERYSIFVRFFMSGYNRKKSMRNDDIHPCRFRIRQRQSDRAAWNRSAPPYQSIGSFASSSKDQLYFTSDRRNSSISKYAVNALCTHSVILQRSLFLLRIILCLQSTH